ncbi:hypothetical protein ACMT4L_18435 [Deinococcus sp. A31D244]
MPTPDTRGPIPIDLPDLVGVSQGVSSLINEGVEWGGQSPPPVTRQGS